MNLPFRQKLTIQIVVFAAVALLAGCAGNASLDSLRAYYFPLEDLRDGKVYVYQSVRNDSLAPSFAFYRTVVNDGKTLFEGIQLDYAMQPKQVSREELVANGMVLVGSDVFQTDSGATEAVRTPLEIEAGTVFPFEMPDTNAVFVYNIRWFEQGDSSKFTRLVRNRFFDKKTTFVWEGKTLSAVKFKVRGVLENFDDGYVEHQFFDEEVYAKGLGLVYFYKNVSSDFTLEYRLGKIYSVAQFEKITGKKVPLEVFGK